MKLIAWTSAVLVGLAAFVVPVWAPQAQWKLVNTSKGYMCEHEPDGTQKPTGNLSKSYSQAVCNDRNKLLTWVNSAEAAVIRTRCMVNPDGSCDSAFPNDGKAPTSGTLAWDDAALATAMAVVANQNTGTATDINLSLYCTGTDCATAAYTLHVAVTGWSIGGTGGKHLLNSGASAGSWTTLGALVLDITASSATDTSASFPWVYVTPPGSDSLAPPIPTDIRVTAQDSSHVVITGDTPWDACGNATCKGTQDVQLQLNGSGTLTTITVGPGFSCNPTLTNVGSMATTPSSTQTGNNWVISGAGTLDGAADAAAFENCQFSGAGFMTKIFGAMPAATANYQKNVLARRESQTLVGAREIYAGVERESIADGGGQDFFVDARVTADAARIHLVGAVPVTPPFCAKIEWDAAGVHNVSTATATGGACNNDWVAQLTNYSLALPATTYVGQAVASGAGGAGAASSVSDTQFDLNNVARWSYTHATGVSVSIGARSRDKQGTPNASAYSTAATGAPSSGSSGAMKFAPGWYGECETQPAHADSRIAIGNGTYNTVKACIDDWALDVPKITGVAVVFSWTSLEGDIAGQYGASASNSIGAAGTIGDPLMDDLLAYIASKGLKLIVIQRWFQSGTSSCGTADSPLTFFPKYMVQTTAISGFHGVCAGTDVAGTYGITMNPATGWIYTRQWKQAVMDRQIALMQHYLARYDANATLEMWVPLFDEADTDMANGTDGYTPAALATQIARIPAGVRASGPRTGVTLPITWVEPPILGTILANSLTNKTGILANDTIVWFNTTQECEYLGLGGQACSYLGAGAFGTHDYRAEIPFVLWSTEPTFCDFWDSKPNADAANNYTPQEFFDPFMTAGKASNPPTLGHPLQPTYWILSKTAGSTCPTVASQQWGTLSSGGYKQFIQTHTPKLTRPTAYP